MRYFCEHFVHLCVFPSLVRIRGLSLVYFSDIVLIYLFSTVHRFLPSQICYILDPTDVVCVIGVIKVKCVGSVRAGERVYATVDLDNPGTAIPESHLPPSVVLGKTSILLGMSMEEKKASKLDDVNLVQCFVCIVLGVNDKEIAAEIENMYDHFEMDLAVKLRRERKKMKRRKYHDFKRVVVLTHPGKERDGGWVRKDTRWLYVWMYFRST